MDGREAKAERETPQPHPGIEAPTTFDPLDLSELEQPVDAVSAHQAEAFDQDRAFDQVRTCPQCGAQDAASARFCRHCGLSFIDAAPERESSGVSPMWAAIAVVVLLALIAGGVFAYRALTRPSPASVAPPAPVASPAPPASSAAPAVATPSSPAAPAPAPPAAVSPPPIADLRPSSGAPAPHAQARAILDPVWRLRPSPEDVSDLYPPQAADDDRTGMAVIDCAVTASGRLSACKVASERPAHYGFGAATLKLASRFRMRSTTRSGEPVAGRRVRVPIRWRLDD